MMLSCFLTGMQFREYLDESRSKYDNKWLTFLVTFIVLLVCPLLYVLNFFIYCYKTLRIKAINWYNYLFNFEKTYNNEEPYRVIKDVLYPKTKGLDKVLLKLVIKKYEKLNNINK